MTESQLRKLLVKPKFRAWLEAKKPGEIVGKVCCFATCPIAEYVRDGAGDYDHVTVEPDIIMVCTHFYLLPDEWVDAPGITMTPPDWCAVFIDTVDFSSFNLITASRALRMLDGIK